MLESMMRYGYEVTRKVRFIESEIQDYLAPNLRNFNDNVKMKHSEDEIRLA